MKKLKGTRGITLIALVVTIVVLLILAAVSISMLGGENGIITQAQNAKLETRAGEVEERVNLWKSEKISSKYTNATVKTEDELLEEMKTDKILFEEEIDRENKLITIGTREISYKIDENGEIGDIPLEPDDGKEELILEYTVGAGETIELPYCLTYDDENNQEKTATFDFQVDWGDGTVVTGINNGNIGTEEKSKHQYTNAGTYEVKIKGIFEALYNSYWDDINKENIYKLGYDKLTKVKQWGTTGLKNVILEESTNLSEIVTPTEGSFKELIQVYFAECTSLKSIPDKLFANCEKIQSFAYCFAGCTNLTIIGDYAFANCTGVKSFQYCFEDCANLTTIGDYAFANCTSIGSFEGCFSEYSNLTTIGNYAFANCTSVQSFEGSFYKCTNLTSIPQNLFANCTNVQSFKMCFYGCTNLTGKAPELWLRVPNGEQNRYIGIPDGENCFYSCTKLENYEQIPGYWKAFVE